YDAIICLGNSFTHLFYETDRRRVLAEFYAALKHDGILIIDQRNYDSILDDGFSTKHKYYYCGDQVSAEPEYVDDGLVRFKYSFPDGAAFTLNLCPIRKNYIRRLLTEAGFERVRTYGDFQETYAESEPDFFIDVADKSTLRARRWDGDGAEPKEGDVREATEAYYDSDDADGFYSLIWGGEDLHVGLYGETKDIRTASDATVDAMADQIPDLGKETRILDIGSGYGGAMRRVAKRSGAAATCLNLSETQNDTNRLKTRQAGLADRIRIVHGAFEAIPEPDAAYDVVWSQDAILHSDQREQVLAEVWRTLKPGGIFVFTDPMQADDAPAEALQPVYDRLGLTSLGSFRFYREAAEAIGFETVRQDDQTGDLRTHYARVREELLANRERLAKSGVSEDYMDRMALGLENWVKAADAGHLAWGIQVFRKPA
ncbi:MAG: methyltransferase domain-containing protein, partial [Alphaproteobacteria bacterium]